MQSSFLERGNRARAAIAATAAMVIAGACSVPDVTSDCYSPFFRESRLEVVADHLADPTAKLAQADELINSPFTAPHVRDYLEHTIRVARQLQRSGSLSIYTFSEWKLDGEAYSHAKTFLDAQGDVRFIVMVPEDSPDISQAAAAGDLIHELFHVFLAYERYAANNRNWCEAPDGEESEAAFLGVYVEAIARLHGTPDDDRAFWLEKYGADMPSVAFELANSGLGPKSSLYELIFDMQRIHILELTDLDNPESKASQAKITAIKAKWAGKTQKKGRPL